MHGPRTEVYSSECIRPSSKPERVASLHFAMASGSETRALSEGETYNGRSSLPFVLSHEQQCLSGLHLRSLHGISAIREAGDQAAALTRVIVKGQHQQSNSQHELQRGSQAFQASVVLGATASASNAPAARRHMGRQPPTCSTSSPRTIHASGPRGHT
jgi:hypothetical protein